jgi:hypothetical protein
LIEIAAKKREESMLKACQQYKASMSPKKKTQTVVKMSKAQGTFNAMDQTERKINTLDIQTLSAEEKQNLIISLRKLLHPCLQLTPSNHLHTQKKFHIHCLIHRQIKSPIYGLTVTAHA